MRPCSDPMTSYRRWSLVSGGFKSGRRRLDDEEILRKPLDFWRVWWTLDRKGGRGGWKGYSLAEGGQGTGEGGLVWLACGSIAEVMHLIYDFLTFFFKQRRLQSVCTAGKGAGAKEGCGGRMVTLFRFMTRVINAWGYYPLEKSAGPLNWSCVLLHVWQTSDLASFCFVTTIRREVISCSQARSLNTYNIMTGENIIKLHNV